MTENLDDESGATIGIRAGLYGKLVKIDRDGDVLVSFEGLGKRWLIQKEATSLQVVFGGIPRQHELTSPSPVAPAARPTVRSLPPSTVSQPSQCSKPGQLTWESIEAKENLRRELEALRQKLSHPSRAIHNPSFSHCDSRLQSAGVADPAVKLPDMARTPSFSTPSQLCSSMNLDLVKLDVDQLCLASRAWGADLAKNPVRANTNLMASFLAGLASKEALHSSITAMGVPISTKSAAGLPTTMVNPPFGSEVGDKYQPCVVITFSLAPEEKASVQLRPKKGLVVIKGQMLSHGEARRAFFGFLREARKSRGEWWAESQRQHQSAVNRRPFATPSGGIEHPRIILYLWLSAHVYLFVFVV